MEADAGCHEWGDGKFPDCVGRLGIPTLTEGPSTIITFEDEDGLEKGGGGATPFPNIPMTSGKTFLCC